MTDFEKVKNLYDELGVKYHLLVSDGGYKYIQKHKAHEREGVIIVGLQEVSLKIPEQLDNYFEFSPDGSLASW